MVEIDRLHLYLHLLLQIYEIQQVGCPCVILFCLDLIFFFYLKLNQKNQIVLRVKKKKKKLKIKIKSKLEELCDNFYIKKDTQTPIG